MNGRGNFSGGQKFGNPAAQGNGMGGQMNGQFRQGPPVAGNQKYKTLKCKFFEHYGQCRYGDKCSFAHGDVEIREGGEGSDGSGSNNMPQTQQPMSNGGMDMNQSMGMMNMMGGGMPFDQQQNLYMQMLLANAMSNGGG